MARLLSARSGRIVTARPNGPAPQRPLRGRIVTARPNGLAGER
jgi:hypothetical protein